MALAMSTATDRLKRPGFGLPLDYMPFHFSPDGKRTQFPHAISDSVLFDAVTCREHLMLEFVCQITDKPNWQTKIHDEAIVKKWRTEACGTAEEQKTSDRHLSMACFDFCMEELRDKATYERKHGVIHVLDVKTTIVKADLAQSDDFSNALREGVKSLENVSDGRKDWHPGSNGLVLDLVHPSLFPLHYGDSRVLPNGTVDLSCCSAYIGDGEQTTSDVLSSVKQDLGLTGRRGFKLNPWGSFQWLPSEISFHDEAARIDSYVNNLHPRHHGELYRVLASAVDKAVPLWNECLSWFHDRMRIRIEHVSYEDFLITPEMQEVIDDYDSDDSTCSSQRLQEFLQEYPHERRLRHPNPTFAFKSFEDQIEQDNLKRYDLRTDFPDGLQVIFKLANIHLTPENPEYSGSNWHVEGALNEHICATALFYYDQENIQDSYLEFRRDVHGDALTLMTEQDHALAAEDMFGISDEAATIQELGKVLTKEGRILAFPNVMQHRVRPFRLADTTRPGHRKILALFLVDPHIPILSTAHVPPQRRDWWIDEIRRSVDRLAALPPELFDRIIEAIGDDAFPMRWEKACEMREELMAERGRITDDYNKYLEEDTFMFCEH